MGNYACKKMHIWIRIHVKQHNTYVAVPNISENCDLESGITIGFDNWRADPLDLGPGPECAFGGGSSFEI